MAENSDMALGYMMASDNNKNCCNGVGYGNGMWGMEWIWLIVILALVWGNGWGNGGFGGGYGNGGGMQGAMTRNDMCEEFSFQDVKNGVRGIQQGICDGFYTANTNMLTGFSGLQAQIANGFTQNQVDLCQVGANVASQLNGTNMAIMQGNNALASQIAECCCTSKYDALQNSVTTNNLIQANTTQGVMNTNAIQNAVQTGFCQTNYNAQSNTRDIIEANAANTRAILDKLTSQEIEAKNAQIQAQSQQIFSLQLAASQAKQNEYLVDQLGQKCPIPAYITCNPFAPQQYSGCGCNG